MHSIPVQEFRMLVSKNSGMRPVEKLVYAGKSCGDVLSLFNDTGLICIKTVANKPVYTLYTPADGYY
jgi:hypothetical protein